MANVYLLVKIGEYYPKLAMDDDRPIYINLYGQVELNQDKVNRLIKELTVGGGEGWVIGK
jgi:hypothetical protein